MYDERDLKLKISKKRQRFVIYLIIALGVLSAGILLMALRLGDTAFFLGIILIITSFVFISNLCAKSSPRVLFSKKVIGKNIKEDIYEVYVRRGVALRPRQVGMPYGGTPLSHTKMAKASLRSSVYLKLDNGDVKEIRGMRVEHVELYEDGDVLIKFAGTKYPVIVGRKSERQVCPLCGAGKDEFSKVEE